MAKRDASSSSPGVSEIVLTVANIMNSDATQKMIKIQASAAASSALRDEVENAGKKLKRHVTEVVEEAEKGLKKRADAAAEKAIADAKPSINTMVKNKAIEEVQALLANHPAMVGYLQQHDASVAAALQQKYEFTIAGLEQKYRDHLDRIIREDQYRIINEALVKELTARYEAAFSQLEAAHKTEHERQALATGVAIQGMINKLSEKATNVEQAHKQLTAVQTRINEQNSEIRILRWLAIAGMLVGTLGVFVGLNRPI